MTNHQIFLEKITPVEDLLFEHVNEKYRSVHIAVIILIYSVLAVLGLLLLFTDYPIWCIPAEILIIVSALINLSIVARAWKFKGYAMRENDITYRSGIIFPKLTTIPFERIQQVSVKQNPVSKFYGLFTVEIINGAQGLSSLTIPGLTEERANQIKNMVIDRLKHDPN